MNYIIKKNIKIKMINQRLNVEDDNILELYKENIDFLIYNTLVNDNGIYSSCICEEEKIKENIYNMVKDYKEEDFIKLFDLCNNILDKSESTETWRIKRGITFLFDVINENSEKFIIAIKAYLKCDTPLSNYISNKIPILIKLIGIEETKKIIFNCENKQKNSWIYEFLFCIPIEKRTLDYANLLRKIFEDEIKNEYPMIPNIQFIALYKGIDKNIVCDLAYKLLGISSPSKSYVIKSFLEYGLNENSANMILDIFEEDINLLKDLYLSAIECNIDYQGHLFIRLVENNMNFLEEFAKKIMSINNKDYHINKFMRLWEQENYHELIKIYFDTIVGSKEYMHLFMYENNLEKIFVSTTNSSRIINDRKISWIKSYIKTNYDNIQFLNLILQVVISTLQDYMEEIVLYFIDINKNIDIFKALELFPTLKSWSGSEVNVIEKEIIFLNKLMDSINGIDYIEHKAYLKELISNKEKYKQQVLVREYLEDIDLS